MFATRPDRVWSVWNQGWAEGWVEGREIGISVGKANVLVRQLKRRFGLTEQERQEVLQCRDVSKLDAAADEVADSGATKEMVLRHLR